MSERLPRVERFSLDVIALVADGAERVIAVAIHLALLAFSNFLARLVVQVSGGRGELRLVLDLLTHELEREIHLLAARKPLVESVNLWRVVNVRRPRKTAIPSRRMTVGR